MKLGDDAHEINLDLTLEEYSRTKEFLMKVLEGFVKEIGNTELLDLIGRSSQGSPRVSKRGCST